MSGLALPVPVNYTKLGAEPLRTIAGSTFTGAYQQLSPLAFPAVILRFLNNSSVAVTISYDGVHDADVILAGSEFTLNIAANRTTNFFFNLPKGSPLYIKASAGTGSFYVASYYAY
jgi:hypothetical protein